MKRIMLFGFTLLSFTYAIPMFTVAMQQESALPLPDTAVFVDATTATQTVTAAAQTTESSTALATLATDDTATITVSIDGMAVVMPLEQYVLGVVSAEISPTFPVEAIKAQAVAARTYAVYKQQAGRTATHPDADVCDDFAHCSAYQDITVQAALWGDAAADYTQIIADAVSATAGEIVLYANTPALTVYSAAAGTKTESALDVWGADVPYLVSVDSASAADCPKYTDTATFSATQARELLQQALPDADLTGDPSTWFKASTRSDAGGIMTVKIGGVTVEGSAVRTIFGLNSTNFTIATTADSLTFYTTGYGHGVGMSQWGAKTMAEQGADYVEILTHYYTGCSVGTVAD